MLFFAGHEEGEIVEPGFVLPAEIAELSLIVGRSAAQEARRGPFEQTSLPLDDRPEVDAFFREARFRSEIGALEDSLLLQFFEADQKMVARMRREALEGRIAVSRGIERQDLPEFLAGILEKIDEGEGSGAEIADAIRAG